MIRDFQVKWQRELADTTHQIFSERNAIEICAQSADTVEQTKGLER
jgi:hypothetical protein